MTAKFYRVFGKKVPPPPSDGEAISGDTSPSVTLLSGFTSPVFDSCQIMFEDGQEIPKNAQRFLAFKTCSGVDHKWGFWSARGHQLNVTFEVSLPAPVDNIIAKIWYAIAAGGSLEGTSCALTITSGSGASATSSSVTWKINTDQSTAIWASSPAFSLPDGLSTITLTVDVAKDNSFWFETFSLVAPPFQSETLKVQFYWKCVHAESIPPNASYKMTEGYSAGVSKSSSSTSSVARELGVSASGGYKGINVGLSKSVTSTLSTTQTVELTENWTKTDEHTYPNKSKTALSLQLWQPVVVYNIGPLAIYDERGDTLIATTQVESS